MNPSPPDQNSQFALDQMREHLYTSVVSDALDGLGYRHQSPRIELNPLTVSDRMLVGRCKTTLWADMAHEDPDPYALELAAIDSCQPDDVMIAAAGGSVRSGVWGELLSTAARNAGCVGAVIDGTVRDVAQVTRMQFPVFARGTSVYDSLHRQRVINYDVVVEIDRVPCRPGELIFADRDGVVIVPGAVETEAIRAAWKKVQDENQTRDAIRAGMKATEAYAKFGVL